MIEGGVEYFLNELGQALDDTTVSLTAAGTIGNARALNAINAAQLKVMRKLLKMGVREQVFARKVTLTDDSNDSDVSLLPYRTFAILSLEDGQGAPYPHIYSRKRTREAGAIVERVSTTTGRNFGWAVRWWNYTRPSTVYAWVLEAPVKLSYGTAGTPTATTIPLAATPTLGDNVLNDDYYNGADIAELTANQIRQVSDFVGSTRVCTVATWTSTPSASVTYEFLTPMPRPTWDAIVWEAAMRVLQSDARWWDEHGAAIAHFRRQRDEAIEEAFSVLGEPIRGEILTANEVLWVS
jgi:hypothetical protein